MTFLFVLILASVDLLSRPISATSPSGGYRSRSRRAHCLADSGYKGERSLQVFE